MKPSVGRSRAKASPPTLKRLVRSYFLDLKDWLSGLVVHYAIAVALSIVGGAVMLAGIGVGVAALFHWIETNHGTYTAYAVVGGGLLVMGVIGIAVGLRLLKKTDRHVPGPQRQIAIAKRNFLAPALLRAEPGRGNVFAADPVSGVLAGTAAVLLAGWVVSSTIHRSRHRPR